LLDQELDGDLPANAKLPKVPAAGKRGFEHTTSLVATVADNTGSRAWFYKIQNATTGEIITNVHEHQLNDDANWETYIAALVAGGTIIT